MHWSLATLPLLLVVGAAQAQPKGAVQPAPAVAASVAARPVPSTGTPTAADVAAKVQKTYDAIQAFEADFDQQYAMKAFGQTKTSKGHVIIVKPGKMRWEYVEPKDNVVVSDGSTLWSYTASDKQARKIPVKDSYMPTALAFLTGKGDLAKEFDLQLEDPGKFKNTYVLRGRPKAATNLYSFVLFYVDAASYQVRRVLVVDAQDNRNRFDFSKPVVNQKYADTVFRWSPPPGVNVISN